MITKNEETLEFFERFQKVKINGNTWEVQAVNSYDADGIIEVALLEAHNNTIEDTAAELKQDKEEIVSAIKGNYEVNPYDTVSYSIEGYSNGSWEVNSKKAQIIKQTDTTVEIFIDTGRSGEFVLSYNMGGERINLPIIIKSL